VVESDPDAHALLLGAEIDPQIAEELRAEIARLGLGDHLSLLGSRADVGRVLTGCTIGVLSSRSEGFPLALLEYGTAALPVVATDVGDCAEILEHGRVGIVVPPADPAALAEAIVSLLADPAERRRLGLLLHERVAATYDADAVMAEVISVYEALAGSRADMAPAP